MTLIINTTSSIANSVNYFNFECKGVLRMGDISSIANGILILLILIELL